MNETTVPGAYPAELRSAAIARDYAQLTYREQYLEDIENELNRIGSSYIQILEDYEKKGGRIEVGTDPDGNEIQNEYIFTFGSSTVVIVFDKDMWPVSFVHAGDIQPNPLTSRTECAEICDALEAVIYRDSPDMAIMATRMGSKELRNMHMVNGIQDLADRIQNDAILLNNAFSGARIEREEMGNGMENQ